VTEGMVVGDDVEPTDQNLLVSSSKQQSNSDDFGKDGKCSSSSNRIVPTTCLYQGVEDQEVQSQSSQQNPKNVSSDSIKSFGIVSRVSNQHVQGVEEEIAFVQRAMEKNVVYMMGEAEVVVEPNSSMLKKIVVSHIYSFLRRNFRQGENLMAIPRSKLLRIGMTYEI